MNYLITNADTETAKINTFNVTKFTQKVRNAEYHRLLINLNIKVI